MDFSSILSHPDHEEIISKLVTGDTPKNINQWLRLKYPNKEQKHLHISAKALQDYADKHINLMDQVKNDLLAEKNNEKIDKKLADSLVNNKTYKQRLAELVDQEIDIKKTIAELVLMIRERVEQVFDIIQQDPGKAKVDYVLIKWFELLLNAVEKFDKIHNNAPDQIIQHNITVQAVEQHTDLIKEAIRETLAQMDPESSLLFMEIFSRKLNSLKGPENNVPSMEQRMAEAKIIKEFDIPELPEGFKKLQ